MGKLKREVGGRGGGMKGRGVSVSDHAGNGTWTITNDMHLYFTISVHFLYLCFPRAAMEHAKAIFTTH